MPSTSFHFWDSLIICLIVIVVSAVEHRIFQKKLEKMRLLVNRQRHALEKDSVTAVLLYNKLQDAVRHGKGMEEVANWESMETCVEMEFAEFSKQINDLLLSAEEIKVCYLAVIGLRNSEISALMNVSASTITRRMQTLSKKGVLFPLGDSEG